MVLVNPNFQELAREWAGRATRMPLHVECWESDADDEPAQVPTKDYDQKAEQTEPGPSVHLDRTRGTEHALADQIDVLERYLVARPRCPSEACRCSRWLSRAAVSSLFRPALSSGNAPLSEVWVNA